MSSRRTRLHPIENEHQLRPWIAVEHTHVIGIKKLVEDAMKMKEPIQSTRLSCTNQGLGLKFNLRKRGTKTSAMAMKGKFIQKSHLCSWSVLWPIVTSQHTRTQVTFCAKAPPMIGPVTEPMDHIALIMPNHCPRILNGTRSVTTMSVSTSSPPPPIPCRERPTSNVAKSFATPATIAPIIKRTRAVIITGFRPKMWEKEAKFGWKIVEQRRKEVPDQKASIAVPLSLSVII